MPSDSCPWGCRQICACLQSCLRTCLCTCLDTGPCTRRCTWLHFCGHISICLPSTRVDTYICALVWSHVYIHVYIDHNYIGHNYIGHNYIRLSGLMSTYMSTHMPMPRAYARFFTQACAYVYDPRRCTPSGCACGRDMGTGRICRSHNYLGP